MSVYGTCEKCGDETKDYTCASCEFDRAETAEANLDQFIGEVSSVLALMDGLAEQWGDEAVFKRCRDRLRAITTQD